MAVLETFSGKLRFHDGTIVESVLTISDDTLSVTADTIEVGTWPMKYCRVSRVDDTEFELNVDGESTWFDPVDPYAFGKAAADRFVGSSIADRINVIRSMPLERMIEVTEPEPSTSSPPPSIIRPDVGPKRNDLRTALFVTIGLIVVLGAVAAGFTFLNSEEEPIVTTTRPPEVESTVPVLFMSTPGGFQDRWNALATEVDAQLVITGRLGIGRFTASLSDHVTITGDVDDDGTIDTLTLRIAPTVEPEQTAFALEAMGTAIEMADPRLTGSQRQRLLQDLGLGYPQDMDLTDVDGTVVRDGMRYRLTFYDLATQDELLFIISEEP